eukprot:jgi/Chlat1/4569/Chrsp29S04598
MGDMASPAGSACMEHVGQRRFVHGHGGERGRGREITTPTNSGATPTASNDSLLATVLPSADEERLQRRVAELRFALQFSQNAVDTAADYVTALRAQLAASEDNVEQLKARVQDLEHAAKLSNAHLHGSLDMLRGEIASKAVAEARSHLRAAEAAAAESVAKEERERLCLESTESRLLYQAKSREVQELKTEIERLSQQHDNELNDMKSIVDQATAEASKWEKEQENSQVELHQLRERCRTLEDELATSQARTQELDAHTAQFEVHQHQTSLHIRWLEERVQELNTLDGSRAAAHFDDELRRVRESLESDNHRMQAQLDMERRSKQQLERSLREAQQEAELERQECKRLREEIDADARDRRKHEAAQQERIASSQQASSRQPHAQPGHNNSQPRAHNLGVTGGKAAQPSATPSLEGPQTPSPQEVSRATSPVSSMAVLDAPMRGGARAAADWVSALGLGDDDDSCSEAEHYHGDAASTRPVTCCDAACQTSASAATEETLATLMSKLEDMYTSRLEEKQNQERRQSEHLASQRALETDLRVGLQSLQAALRTRENELQASLLTQKEQMQARIDVLQAEVLKLQEEIRKLRQNVVQLQTQIDSLHGVQVEGDSHIDFLKQAHEKALQACQSDMQKQVEGLRIALADAESRLIQEQKAFAEANAAALSERSKSNLEAEQLRADAEQANLELKSTTQQLASVREELLKARQHYEKELQSVRSACERLEAELRLHREVDAAVLSEHSKSHAEAEQLRADAKQARLELKSTTQQLASAREELLKERQNYEKEVQHVRGACERLEADSQCHKEVSDQELVACRVSMEFELAQLREAHEQAQQQLASQLEVQEQNKALESEVDQLRRATKELQQRLELQQKSHMSALRELRTQKDAVESELVELRNVFEQTQQHWASQQHTHANTLRELQTERDALALELSQLRNAHEQVRELVAEREAHAKVLPKSWLSWRQHH